MLIARYLVHFPDLDWRRLVSACGAEFLHLDRINDDLVLVVRGSRLAIDTLSGDLDFGPFEIDANSTVH